MENLYLIIGERIKKQRIDLNIKQKDLATVIGINRTSISNIEKGRHQPPLHIIYKICDYFNSDVAAILPTIDELNRFNQMGENKDLFNLIRHNNKLSEDSKNNIETFINNLG